MNTNLNQKQKDLLISKAISDLKLEFNYKISKLEELFNTHVLCNEGMEETKVGNINFTSPNIESITPFIQTESEKLKNKEENDNNIKLLQLKDLLPQLLIKRNGLIYIQIKTINELFKLSNKNGFIKFLKEKGIISKEFIKISIKNKTNSINEFHMENFLTLYSTLSSPVIDIKEELILDIKEQVKEELVDLTPNLKVEEIESKEESKEEPNLSEEDLLSLKEQLEEIKEEEIIQKVSESNIIKEEVKTKEKIMRVNYNREDIRSFTTLKGMVFNFNNMNDMMLNRCVHEINDGINMLYVHVYPSLSKALENNDIIGCNKLEEEMRKHILTISIASERITGQKETLVPYYDFEGFCFYDELSQSNSN